MKHRYRIRHPVFAPGNGLHGAHNPRRDHDFVEDYLGLLDGAQHISPGDLGPGLDCGDKLPDLFPVQGGGLHPPLEAVAGHAHNGVQGALDAVIDAADESRAQLYTHGLPGGFHRLPGPQARGLLIHLNGGVPSVYLDNFPNEPLAADPHHVKHIGVPHPFGNDQRSGHLSDNPFAHGYHHSFLPRQPPARMF